MSSKPKSKAGRKRKVIDWALVDNMLIAHCTGTEVAAALGMKCADTLYLAVKEKFKMDFSAYQQQKQATGKELLRRKMFSQALKDNNTTERIFLSKNLLGYSDKEQAKILLELKKDIHLSIGGEEIDLTNG